MQLSHWGETRQVFRTESGHSQNLSERQLSPALCEFRRAAAKVGYGPCPSFIIEGLRH